MGFTCEKCGVQFAKQRDLQSHMARKRPCDAVLSHQCQHCLKPFTRADNKSRHQTKCLAALTTQNRELQARLDVIEQQLLATKVTTVVNGPVTVVNHINHNNITIQPWGSPFMLTDNDVAAVLARISGPASALTSKQVADALVHAVQLAHVSLEARNIYLDPKQSDRVVVFDQGWGYQQLTTAVPVLLNRASVRISAPSDSTNELKSALPAKYNADKEQVDQLGERTLRAHLANMMPGGAGPILPPPLSEVVIESNSMRVTELTANEAADLMNKLPTEKDLTFNWLLNTATELQVNIEQLVFAISMAGAKSLCKVSIANKAVDVLREHQIIQQKMTTRLK